ncbi:hypothetical protein [Micromonospora sp. NPDC005806]|uniref:galactose-binding domain-containing protein n=1 Tax=Micromonospora sp. NPDC005806 TaxID=3364234 RepID=UPI00368E9433
MAAALLAVVPLVAVNGSGQTAAAKDGGDKDGVVIAVSPQRLELLPRPCQPTALTVAFQNPSAEPAYATVTLRGDPPLRLSRDIMTTAVPTDRAATWPIDVSVPGDTQPGEYEIVLESGRQRISVPVVVLPEPADPGRNLAFGQEVTASSTFPRLSPPCGPVDGDYTYTFVGYHRPATAWADDTPGQFPDQMEVRLAGPTQVGRVDLFTDPQQRFALRDWDVEVLTGAGWQTVAQVRGHTSGRGSSSFPAVTASAVRVTMLATNGYGYSIVNELEVYEE